MTIDREKNNSTEIQYPLDVALTDLRQVQELLHDAVENLLTNALTVRAASATLQNVAQQIVQRDSNSLRGEELMTLSHEIAARSSDTIVQLQFQDMVTQLLGHAAASIDATSVDAGQTTGVTAMQHKPVAASQMQIGDVELF